MAQRNGRSKCVGSGMRLGRWAGSETIYFRENIAGYARTDELVVPHSELAMHVKAAGRPLIAWACKGRSCGIVYEESDGGCGYVDGLAGEVLDIGLRKGNAAASEVRRR